MSYYNKFISYIELYEQNEKIKNIGFIKSETRDDIWKATIHIKGLAVTDSLLCEMQDSVTGKRLEQFRLKEGCGEYSFTYHTEELLQKGLSFFEMEGLFFMISANRYGLCSWKTDKALEKPLFSEPPETLKLAAAEAKTETGTELRAEEGDTAGAEAKEDIKAEVIKEETIQEENQDLISSDKWQQLCRMYSCVHPFAEEEKGEFLSITPKEFVVLSEKYQNLANNSFLLHGFYNYRHILLGRNRVEKEMRYYIGVPGIYHDREKTVAVMFGFEAFEALERETQGAFGYYMKTVEI